MATTRPFAYNPSAAPVVGATQFGNLAIGDNTVDYSTNPGELQWFMGPDEDPGYVVALAVTGGNFPTPSGSNDGTVQFWRTEAKTDPSFLSLANVISYEHGGTGPFANATLAKTWLNTNGYWTSWGIVLNGLIIQLDAYDADSYPGSGSTVYDITGSYDHTLTGATFTTLSGIKCFDCTTGTNSVVVNGIGPTLPTTGYTYITWARVEAGNPLSFRTLLYTNSPKYTPITIPNGTNTLGYWDTEFRSSGYDLSSSVGVWVQYAVVGDSSSQTFYINGSQVGSPIAFGSGGRTHWGWGNNTVPQPWGYVANLYLYNRKLSLTEIQEQYNFLSPRFNEL